MNGERLLDWVQVEQIWKTNMARMSEMERSAIGQIRNQHIHVGCAGWSIPREFAGNFSGHGSHLQQYAEALGCTEINSSFHRSHKQQTWERWAAMTPNNFSFSVKAPKTVTHEARLNCAREELNRFLDEIKSLGGKLGPILFQLPPSLEFDKKLAEKFLLVLRELHPGNVAWEPRHESWFQSAANGLLEKFAIARVAADPACVPAAADPGASKALFYFRLHGSPRRYYSAYSGDFLNGLAEKIRNLSTNAQLWCVFDNTASGAAMGNALELTRSLRARVEEDRRAV